VRRILLLVVALTATALFAPAASQASTKWLCKPGAKKNPCDYGLSTTRISPSGKKLGTVKTKRDARRPIDCFYVYPTVSDQQRPDALRKIEPSVRSIAIFQASRYSQVCRVFAPLYRQITLQGLGDPTKVTPAMRTNAYNDVRDAWRDYLKRHNKGRGVVLVGHSQGSFVLRRLIAQEIDGKPAARKRLVSAQLTGGNVEVKKGSDRGGDFKNVRACRSRTQLGCVVAFSTFDATPPDDALFGRTSAKGKEVLCTNPAALGGGTAPIDTLVPSEPYAEGTLIGLEVGQVGFVLPKVKTAWIESKGAFRAHCSSAGGADVLRIAGVKGAPDLNALPTPGWGLHLSDANIALGDQIRLVRTQSARYTAR
jgi:hypothetical protein